jgi:hypothetical protein
MRLHQVLFGYYNVPVSQLVSFGHELYSVCVSLPLSFQYLIVFLVQFLKNDILDTLQPGIIFLEVLDVCLPRDQLSNYTFYVCLKYIVLRLLPL